MHAEKLPNLSELIPLNEVGRLLPTRTHRSTVFRWAQKGARGVHLRVVAVGGTLCTTEAWLMAFFTAVEHARRDQARSQQPTVMPRRHRHVTGGPVLPRPGTLDVLRRHGLMS